MITTLFLLYERNNSFTKDETKPEPELNSTLTKAQREVEYLKKSWLLPKNFLKFREETLQSSTHGYYRSIKIPGHDKLSAGICPRYYGNDKTEKIISCTIDIALNQSVVAAVDVPLEYIDLEFIKQDIEKIITIDGQVIKFNLGRNQFEYTLDEKRISETRNRWPNNLKNSELDDHNH